jgi:hypothetical protein
MQMAQPLMAGLSASDGSGCPPSIHARAVGRHAPCSYVTTLSSFAVLFVLLLATSAPAFDLDAGHLGRWTISGYAEADGILATNHASRLQHPATIFSLRTTGRLGRRVRVHLDTRTTFGGTPRDLYRGGVTNLSDTFQSNSPGFEMEEGYVDLLFPRLDVRVGKQKFTWGKLDVFRPLDVINPRRLNDPFIDEERDAKIGAPALSAAYYPTLPGAGLVGNASLTLVWVPVPVAPRLPPMHERWFPPQASVPSRTTIPFDDIKAPIIVRNTLRTEERRPPQQLDEGAVALRAAGSIAGIDSSLVYYDGPETAIGLALDVSAILPRVHRTIARGGKLTGEDFLHARADEKLRPRFGRIRLIGGDAAFQLRGFTARVEAAYGTDRLLPRSASHLFSAANLKAVVSQGSSSLGNGKRTPIDLGDLFVERDTAEWGAGIDYQYRGWMPLLQVNQTLVLNNSTRLLLNDVDTRFLVALRKTLLGEHLTNELALVHGLERGYTTGVIRATYAVTDNLRFRVGYLLIAGSRETIVGQFHANDELFAQLRYSF